MGFNTVVQLVIDRADGEIAFEFFESLYHLGKLNIVLPGLAWILFYEIGTKQITTFSLAHFAELVFAKSEGEGL